MINNIKRKLNSSACLFIPIAPGPDRGVESPFRNFHSAELKVTVIEGFNSQTDQFIPTLLVRWSMEIANLKLCSKYSLE